jgi:hypothetical protein
MSGYGGSIQRENQADASRLPKVTSQRDRYRKMLRTLYRAYPKEIKEMSSTVFEDLEKLLHEPIE